MKSFSAPNTNVFKVRQLADYYIQFINCIQNMDTTNVIMISQLILGIWVGVAALLNV